MFPIICSVDFQNIRTNSQGMVPKAQNFYSGKFLFHLINLESFPGYIWPLIARVWLKSFATQRYQQTAIFDINSVIFNEVSIDSSMHSLLWVCLTDLAKGGDPIIF